jgi:effector-binding domain-containing protein
MLKLKHNTLITIATLLLTGNVMAVEEAKYSTLLAEGKFELRNYQPHIVAETIVDTDFEDAGSEAFNRLFKYISGENKAQQKVAMTSPVGQSSPNQNINMTAPVSQEKQDGKWAVSFMMPDSFTLETTPEPKNPSVTIRQVPARSMAAVRYSGFWSVKNYERHLKKLNEWIEVKGYQVVGEPIWARYDAPYIPWFLRRNEILIAVEVSGSS